MSAFQNYSTFPKTKHGLGQFQYNDFNHKRRENAQKTLFTLLWWRKSLFLLKGLDHFLEIS